ncbi:MAG: hypothetical protein PHD74_03565 [Candidatus Krumholzibacteria bacterium]|nr:hypothetical protein [Candidatus Krumholzibacteria bacterium]
MMILSQRGRAVLIALMSLFLVLSCSKKETKTEGAPPDSTKKDTTLSYVSQEVSFSVFFDEQCTKRTIKLGSREKELVIYIAVNFPETMQIAAVEYRLALPKGLAIENDKFYAERAALLGTFDAGISETFPCVVGPRIVLHALTLNVTEELKNAEIQLLPAADAQFIGVAMCDHGNTLVPAGSYKAVVNPIE